MDPYREKDPLDAVNKRLQSILKELERLQPTKTSPIRDSIAFHIKEVNLTYLLFKVFVGLIIVSFSAAPVVSIIMPNPISSCEFDIETGDIDPGVYIYVEKDWRPGNKLWGPFSSFEEAYEYGKVNDCPNLPPLSKIRNK